MNLISGRPYQPFMVNSNCSITPIHVGLCISIIAVMILAMQITSGRFIDSSNEAIWATAWKIYWSIIDRCNLILDKIDSAEFTVEENRDYIKGEAYILRA